LFIITQQVQPASIIPAMQSQQARIMAQQASSPLVQVMQTPSAVISHLQRPMTRLQQQATMPFISMQQLQRPPAIIVQRFCSVAAAVGSSAAQVIFMPPGHFSMRTVQRGTIIMFIPAGIAGVPIAPAPRPIPMAGIPIPAIPMPAIPIPERSVFVALAIVVFLALGAIGPVPGPGSRARDDAHYDGVPPRRKGNAAMKSEFDDPKDRNDSRECHHSDWATGRPIFGVAAAADAGREKKSGKNPWRTASKSIILVEIPAGRRAFSPDLGATAMRRERYLGEGAIGPVPAPVDPAATLAGFVVCPFAVGPNPAGMPGGWALSEVYRIAYERAQADLRPSWRERALTPSRN
jgi:hypothetical protein